jgi:hypothetical protein
MGNLRHRDEVIRIILKLNRKLQVQRMWNVLNFRRRVLSAGTPYHVHVKKTLRSFCFFSSLLTFIQVVRFILAE